MELLYIGPGIGAATIVVVLVVCAIVTISFLMILWTPVKKIFRKLFKGKKR